MKNTSKIQKILGRSQTIFSSKFEIDISSILDAKSSDRLKNKKVIHSNLKEILSNRYSKVSGFRIEDHFYEGQFGTGTPPFWVTQAKAQEIKSYTGDNIELAIQAVEVALDIIEADDNYEALELLGLASAGVVGTGLTIAGMASTTMSSIMGAGVAAGNAIILSGGTEAAALAAAGEAAELAAVGAGLSEAGAAAAGVAASTGSAWGLSGMLSCMAATICTPLGAAIIVVAAAILILGFIYWLANRQRDIGALIVNNTNRTFTLNGGSGSLNGIYMDSGDITYLPATFDDSDPDNPKFLDYGLPSMIPIPDNQGNTNNSIEFIVPVSFMGATNESGGASGICSLEDNNGIFVMPLFANPRFPKTGVYIATNSATSGLSSLYETYYDLREKSMNFQDSQNNYNLFATANSQHGTEAYAIYFIEDLV